MESVLLGSEASGSMVNPLSKGFFHMRVHILLEEILSASLIPAAVPIYKVWNKLVMQLKIHLRCYLQQHYQQYLRLMYKHPYTVYQLPLARWNHGKLLHPRNQKRKTRRNIYKCIWMNEIHQRSFDQ
jgi:hypothetical protein